MTGLILAAFIAVVLVVACNVAMRFDPGAEIKRNVREALDKEVRR